jgi:hypothetical protein
MDLSVLAIETRWRDRRFGRFGLTIFGGRSLELAARF